jgi:beta-glucosidase
VLLKNNGSVLPIRPGAKVLVTGPGANSIAMQSGGWTVSWQGSDVTNADFPNGQTIYSALAEAIQDAGGQATLSADGSTGTKPDVAIVVFGESPYAEFLGDVPTLAYQPGEQRDLALLRRLKAQGIPTVSVFLSGRPMRGHRSLRRYFRAVTGSATRAAKPSGVCRKTRGWTSRRR